VSALDPGDTAALHDRIVAWLERAMIDASLFVPYTTPRVLHVIRKSARVLSEAHEEAGTRLSVRAPAAVIQQLRAAGAV